METRFLTQPKIAFEKTIREHLGNHDIAFIATAYITEDGIKTIKKELLQKSSVKILCGVHGCISDLSALKKLVLQSNNRIAGRVFLGTNVFHPKLYLFQNKESATLLVGSSNLTGSGLRNNEEVCVESMGTLSSHPIVDAIAYFKNIWDTNSVPVDKYLQEHPNYSVRQSQNDNLTVEQKQKLDLLKKEVITTSSIVFNNRVNKTLLSDGKQTVPTKFNDIIDNCNLCNLHKSVSFDIILPDRQSVLGQLYYGDNNTGYYYQFKISGSRNIGKLKDQIKTSDTLKYNIDLSKRVVRINRA